MAIDGPRSQVVVPDLERAVGCTVTGGSRIGSPPGDVERVAGQGTRRLDEGGRWSPPVVRGEA